MKASLANLEFTSNVIQNSSAQIDEEDEIEEEDENYEEEEEKEAHKSTGNNSQIFNVSTTDCRNAITNNCPQGLQKLSEHDLVVL